MQFNLLTSNQAAMIVDLDRQGTPWMFEKDYPNKKYCNSLKIPYWFRKEWPDGFLPIILRGSRAGMYHGYVQSQDRVAREVFCDRVIRKFKVTWLKGDPEPKELVELSMKVDARMKKIWPCSRYWFSDALYYERMGHSASLVRGKASVLNQNQITYIRKLLVILNKIGNKEIEE